jgi:hypothetical protein
LNTPALACNSGPFHGAPGVVGGLGRTAIELSKGATPIVLLLLLLLPQSNLESKSKSMIKSKRQGMSPNSTPMGLGDGPPGEIMLIHILALIPLVSDCALLASCAGKLVDLGVPGR